MNPSTFRRGLLVLVIGLGFSLGASPARGQQIIIKGMYGMMAGTQPPPGFYAGAFGSFSWADELKGPDGNTLNGPSLNQQIFGPLATWVSNFKILGGNYGVVAGVPFANIYTDAPRLGLGNSSGIALSQLYVVPLQLGWHLKGTGIPLADNADIVFHYAFYAPTGRYTAGADNNTGLGMWANELSLRVTTFFDKDKLWHGSASVFYDINSKKEGIDWKTGNPITYMWGLGRNYGADGSMFKGWLGAAGYAQWQVSSTTGRDVPDFVRDNKTTIYAAGPELTTLQGALTVRYLWQFGGKFSTQGQGLYVQFVMPF